MNDNQAADILDEVIHPAEPTLTEEELEKLAAVRDYLAN